MTPAELAKYSAISFEAKKDSLRQTQAGTWKITFTVQGLDMDERLTKAFPGTRYVAVLVEVDDLEMPVSKQPEKEVVPNSRKPVSTGPDNAQPQPDTPDKPSAGAKRMDWRELQPAAQAGIRCDDPVFTEFLKNEYAGEWYETIDSAKCVRMICGVTSRSELGTNHKARVLWHQLDSAFLAWKYVDA